MAARKPRRHHIKLSVARRPPASGRLAREISLVVGEALRKFVPNHFAITTDRRSSDGNSFVFWTIADRGDGK